MTKKILILFSLLFYFMVSLSSAQVMPIKGYSDDSVYRMKMKSFISEWWESPYKWGGSSKRGIDCSSFTQKLFKEVYKVNSPRTSREQYKIGKKVPYDSLQTGDLLFFKNSRGIWHVGTYIYKGFFVHSSSHEGVHVSNLSEDYYAEHLFGYRRILKSEDIY